jgi:NAD+ synthase (glutamine-hydrolysing)
MLDEPGHPGPDRLRVAGAQIENRVGDLDGNTRRILAAMQWAEEQEADVVVFPELVLTGYPLADLVLREEFAAAAHAALERLARGSGRTAAVVGTIGAVPPRRSWDTRERSMAISAALLCDGQVRGMYNKVLLPNYEVFDEARNFAPGDQPGMLWRIGPAVAGVSICEDLWSGDGPPEAQAAAGARILLVPNASPFHQEKPADRLALASEVARRNGVPVVYVNSVGGQDDLVFDGGSLAVGADGQLLYRACQFAPENFVLDVPLGPARPLAAPARTVHARPRQLRPPVDPPASPAQASGDEQVWQAVVLATRDFVRRNGATTVVLGLSGGIDAAVTAAVAAEAVGPENVLGVAMPSSTSPEEELEDARALATALGIELRVAPIDAVTQVVERVVSPALEARASPDIADALEARARAAVLWTIFDQQGNLPLATGNKSELSIGLAALNGDMAGAFAPLKDCSKSLLYRLAQLRNARAPVIPQRVLDRTPTIKLDEATSLPSYAVLDPIVERYLERGYAVDDLVEAGFDPAIVRGVLQLVDNAELKRRQAPPGPKISSRAFGQDLRMPITNEWRPFRADEAEILPPEAQPDPWPPAQPAGVGDG